MKWFRFYSEVLDDPKVQRLPASLFKHWVNLMCLANEGQPRGVLPPTPDIAFRLRISERQARSILSRLRAEGLLDETASGALMPHNWTERQKISDDGAARVRRHRARKAAQDKDQGDSAQVEEPAKTTSDVTLHETLPDTLQVTTTERDCNALDTDTDIDTEIDTDRDRDRDKDIHVRSHSQPKAQAKPTERKTTEYGSDFEEFWSHYPRRIGKKAAYAKWRSRLRQGVHVGDLITAAKHYAVTCRGREEHYVMHATTFLGPNERWRDYLAPPRDSPSPQTKAQPYQRQQRSNVILHSEGPKDAAYYSHIYDRFSVNGSGDDEEQGEEKQINEGRHASAIT